MARRLCIALLSILALLAVGCGSDALEGDSATGPTSTPIDEDADGASTTGAPAETTSTPAAPAEVATTTTTDDTTAETTTAAPASADQVGLIGGGQFDLGSIEGTDTVLWFWAPW